MAEKASQGQLKPQVYKDPRPPSTSPLPRAHAREAARTGCTRRCAWCSRPTCCSFFRTRAIDSDKVPADGPAIVAPNHFSFLDHFFVAVYLRRKVQFMAKSQLFKGPLQFVYHNGGVFPVRRGHRDEEAFKTAHAVLARGGIVVMYCEGGRSRTGELGEAKPGIGRLALESGAPVVPVGARGLGAGARLEAAPVPEGHACSSAIRSASSASRSPPRDQSQAASEEIFDRASGALWQGLRENGRSATVKAARAAPPRRRGRGRRPASRAPGRRFPIVRRALAGRSDARRVGVARRGRLPRERLRWRCWPAASRSRAAGDRAAARVGQAARRGAHVQPAQRPAPGLRAGACARAPAGVGVRVRRARMARRQAGGPTGSPGVRTLPACAAGARTVRLRLTRSGRGGSWARAARW